MASRVETGTQGFSAAQASPFTAATHVGTGLMEIDTTEYCNKSAVIQGISNVLILAIAILFGAVR